MWDLPGPGLEPVSPALAGGFLTTVPPRKPLCGSIETVQLRWDLNPRAGTWTQPKPRLGFEPMVFLIEITHLVSKLKMKLRFLMSPCRKNSVRDKVIGKKWIYLKRYTFHRQNVVHLKRREWHWEKHSTDRMWTISEGERPRNMGCLVFMRWVIS